MHCASTLNPTKTKDVKYNKPTHSAKEVNFTTAVDTLMKAIQKRSDSERITDLTPSVTPDSPRYLRQSQSDSTVIVAVWSSAEEAASPTKPVKSRNHACDVDGCSKSFHQKAHLETHKRAHTGERPYACDWPGCGRTFSQPGNLKTHVRRHTDEKPFRCEQCSKAFAQRGYLKTHVATHINAKPFVCKLDQYNKTFTRRGNLKNHQNKCHENTLMELTDWVVSLSDTDGLSDDDHEMYWYFANLYKNSNKGIKGRGKGRRVANVSGKDDKVRKSRSARRPPTRPMIMST
ncbi:C2H2 transcription factor [Colletotrichum kahawae]|uniref:C2H2 transcription factor n=1 Tax=Colletotrichum kahawae TaxID=34407 RepID=A0AAE0D8R4_COLKA|nr:C2H2 transcription factor [Colletotrichum kahawae]